MHEKFNVSQILNVFKFTKSINLKKINIKFLCKSTSTTSGNIGLIKVTHVQIPLLDYAE